MRILCTFPGRAGDLLWALPTVRAVSEHWGVPVSLAIAEEFAPLVDLLATQPYLGLVLAVPDWHLTPPNEWEAPVPDRVAASYDRIYHLGYRGWPELPLPFETQRTLEAYGWRAADGSAPQIDLDSPWITRLPPLRTAVEIPCELATGFTEAWFELKAGLVECLGRVQIPELHDGCLLTPYGSRWTTELGYAGSDWVRAAHLIQDAKVFLGDCSALHVLAVAIGKPVVVVEPMEARWNPIFYPLGTDGRVRLVRGNDGLPTFDARHTADTLREVARCLTK